MTDISALISADVGILLGNDALVQQVALTAGQLPDRRPPILIAALSFPAAVHREHLMYQYIGHQSVSLPEGSGSLPICCAACCPTVRAGIEVLPLLSAPLDPSQQQDHAQCTLYEASSWQVSRN